MAVSIDLDTGTQIVQQLFPNAADPLMTIELEATKIGNNYRPYLVAAKLIMTEYRRVVRADVVTFDYSDDTIRNLLKRQQDIDKINGVTDDTTIEDMLAELCTVCTPSVDESTPALGVMLI